MSRFAQEERAALCDLFLEVGPDAPTLCEGWTAADLAAHLVIRERRPDAAPGIALSFLGGYTGRVQRAVRDAKRWEDLVDTVRHGPPFPLRLPFVDEQINTAEYVVHHEDVRRARPGWEPRTLDGALERTLFSRLRLMARLARSPVGLVLEAPGYGQVTVRRGSPSATLVGPPSELLLFVFGRDPAVRIEKTGDDEALARLGDATFGF